MSRLPNNKSGEHSEDIIRHIYVHIPFCARICPYCAFYKDLLDRSQTPRFCEAIVAELEQQRSHRRLAPSTIYFGGGTPTALTTSQLEFVLGGFRKALDLSGLAEWTIEANPGSVSARKAALLREFGVTRISLGVQSWDDALLETLGREHNAAQAEESFNILRDAGFENINVDLMFGLPGQTVEQWERTLQETVSLNPEHISAYCLTFEEDTDFFLRFSRGELRQDSDSDAQMFETAIRILSADRTDSSGGEQSAGYEHYEISNYAQPGYESVHNRAYWAGEDYLGIGPSAFSTVGLKRWQNVCDYRGYADRVLAAESPIGSVEDLTNEMKRTERIALMLRTNRGIPSALVQDRHAQAREFVDLGLLRELNGHFLLTKAGKNLADSVAESLV